MDGGQPTSDPCFIKWTVDSRPQTHVLSNGRWSADLRPMFYQMDGGQPTSDPCFIKWTVISRPQTHVLSNRRWTADLRPMFYQMDGGQPTSDPCFIKWTVISRPQTHVLSNGVPSWIYSELSFHAVAVLTEYHVNQNGEITLPYSVPHKTFVT